MPLAAPIALLLTDHTTRTKGLFLGGVDVNKNSTYGVPIDTVTVEEAGPGGVSWMSFDIDDPAIAITVQDGMDVRFWDYTNDVPIFTGWVQSWSYQPDFGNQGRTISVRAIGADAILDWAIIPALTLPLGMGVAAAIQAAATAAIGTGPLRAFSPPSSATHSTQAIPIDGFDTSVLVADLTFAVTTLREAIRQIIANVVSSIHNLPGAYCTVDFYYGLRAWPRSFPPTDWTTVTITDTPAGALASENLVHEVDAAGIIRGVYVTGGNAAGTGFVPDGTGLMGPISTLSDSTILSADELAVVANAYLSSFGSGERGQFTLTSWTPTVTVHAGVTVGTFTDARIGNVVSNRQISSITKTFEAVQQNWTFHYGGLAPSAMRAIRRQTRSVLN